MSLFYVCEEAVMKIRGVQGLMAVSIGITVSLAAVHASAFVPEDLARLTSTKQCPGCDLRGADLRGAKLDQAVLEGANLLGANLEGVSLKGAILDDAALERVNFKNATLNDASLDHATADGADFAGANLEGSKWLDGKVCKKGSIGACK